MSVFEKLKTNYVVIGSRPYYNIHLNGILDIFEKNIRCNMSLPNHNNGTKIDEQFLNVHVFEYTMNCDNGNKSQRRKGYLEMFNDEYVKEYDNFDITRWVKVYRQNNSDIHFMNKWLKEKQIPTIKENVLRVGMNAIWMLLNKNDVNIYIHGFSLQGDHKKRGLINENMKNTSHCHDIVTEQRCLINLHNLNYLDATLCSLEDHHIPTFDCGNIKPKKEVLLFFLKQFGIVTLTNFYKSDVIAEMKNELLRVFQEQKKAIQILDKEGCSNDERIFNIEKESKYIKDTFSNNILFNIIAKYYTGRPLKKKTLANKLIYEPGKRKNSGAGWHRDNHDMQFKCLMYLTDVTEKNGNFQFITNSSKRHIGYPTPRTSSYNTRFADSTVDTILNTNNDCQLYNVVGKAGTLVIADTTYIHRGNIIEEGERLALTEYFI